jgi:hypothetical protein
MPNSYLYYRRGDEWVRVDADRSTIAVTPSGYQFYVGPNWIRSGSNGCPLGGEYIAYYGATPVPASPTARFYSNGFGECTGEIYLLNFNGHNALFKGYPTWMEEKLLGCETKFYKNNDLVLRLSSCPEVTNGRGCNDCCRELLPLLRGVRI